MRSEIKSNVSFGTGTSKRDTANTFHEAKSDPRFAAERSVWVARIAELGRKSVDVVCLVDITWTASNNPSIFAENLSKVSDSVKKDSHVTLNFPRSWRRTQVVRDTSTTNQTGIGIEQVKKWCWMSLKVGIRCFGEPVPWQEDLSKVREQEKCRCTSMRNLNKQCCYFAHSAVAFLV